MNISLCNSLFSFDSLFRCIFDKQEKNNPNPIRFSLVIDKRLDSYPFNLKLENARISFIDTYYRYITNPASTMDIPPIFLKKHIKGQTMEQVIHEDVLDFYKNVVKSSIIEKKVLSLHIILNSFHILIVVHPVYDNKKKVIGSTILEIPYADVESFI